MRSADGQILLVSTLPPPDEGSLEEVIGITRTFLFKMNLP